jgi:epoxyqueuosine reductase
MAQLAGLGNFGKNTLIINPEYGPWFRLRSILIDAELVPDRPFTDDLCGGCDECIKSCPVGALTPYRLDPDRCLLGMTWEQRRSKEFAKIWDEHCPPLTRNTYLMCMTCQRACIHGRELRGLD